MTKLMRRIQKLEERCLPRPETEFEQYLRERMEAGRRRVAQARGEAEPMEAAPSHTVLAPAICCKQPDFVTNHLVRILHRGRDRVRRENLPIQGSSAALQIADEHGSKTPASLSNRSSLAQNSPAGESESCFKSFGVDKHHRRSLT